jgi:hypothetical protein
MFMCIICVDLDKKKLTPWEAAKNRTEMIEQVDKDHLEVLDLKIREALLEYLNDLPKQEEQKEDKVELWF